MSEAVEFVMPRGGAIAVGDGEHVQMFTDGYTAAEGTYLPPIKRAAIVARLRALADQLEAATP